VVNNPKAHLAQEMLKQLTQLPVKSVLNIQLCAQTPSDSVGMYGSGMCILNPPWQLENDLAEILEQLTATLVSDNNKLSTIEWLKTE
jgi:23S rRNA (adenine2030-N6)-methyltransferase